MKIKILLMSLIIMLEGMLSGGCEIYADILDNINDSEEYINESLETEDNTASSSALSEIIKEDGEFYEDTEEDTLEEAESIIDNNEKYSDLSFNEKFILNDKVGLREDTMIECEKRGYSISDSVYKALIMQRLNISFDDTLLMIEMFGNEQKAANETLKFRKYEYSCAFMNDEEVRSELLEELKNGVETEKIMDIYAFSKIKEITYKEAAELLEEERENFEEELYNKKFELGIIEETEISTVSEETEDWASADAAEATLSGMFNVRDDINESINYSTGGLVLEDTAAIIPGRNGLDLEIKFKYNSSLNLNESSIYNLETGAGFIFSEDSIEIAKKVNKL